jgi:UDP-N-acetyl-2-amino-2-deoxyglucuronate dehydrogenase
MKNKILFGLLGLGRVVQNRVSKVFSNELKFSKVQVVYDKKQNKKDKIAKLFCCKSAFNIKDFFNQKTDYIYIATESGSHYQDILKCFSYNKNVIVEKPPVLKVLDLIKLDKIAKKKKLEFYVIFQNRFNKSVQYIKKKIELIKKEKIIFLTLDLLWSRNQSYYNDWHGKWRSDGGVLAQQGIHYIDLLCYFLGKPKKCISFISKKSNKLQAEDTHCAIIIFKDNISCTVNMTTALKPKDVEASIKIYTQKKIYKLKGLCCNNLEIQDNFDANSNYNAINKSYSQKVPTGYGLSHKEVFQNIINFRLKKTKQRPLLAIESIDTLRLINMLYKSYENQKWVYYSDGLPNSKLGN